MRRYISGGLAIVISIVILIMLISLGNLLVKAEPTQDTTPPIINVTPESTTGYINKPITVNYEVIDDESGVQKIQYYWSSTTTKPSSWSNLSDTSGTLTYEYSGIRYLHIQAWDNEGNYSYKWFGPYQIDLLKPTVSISPSSRSSWSKQVTVTIEARDTGGSGVKNIQYRISADEGSTWGGWITVTENPTEITLSNSGKYKIEAVAEDNAGNVSNTVIAGTYRIDSDSPEISVDNEGGWVSSSVKISVTDTGGSGVTYLDYSWSKSKNTPGSWNSIGVFSSSGSYTISTVSIGNEGTWYLHLRIRDAAGNETGRVYGPYNVDKKRPTVSFSPFSSPDGVSASSGGTGEFKVKIQASDDNGLKKFQYAISEDGGNTWGSFIDVEGDSEIIGLKDPGKYKIKLRAEDLAGNVTEDISCLYNIDGIPPTITADIEKQEEFSSGSLRVTVTVNDGQNNLYYIEYATTTSVVPPSSSSSWVFIRPSSQSHKFSVTMSYSGTYYLHVRTADSVGNTTYRCFGPYNIGTNNVRIWAEPGTAEWTFSDINVTIKAAHYNNEIDYIAYRIYNSYTDSYSDWQYVYSDTAEIKFTEDDLYKIEAYAVSKSGTKSTTQVFGPYFKKLPRANYSLRQGTIYENKLYAGMWDDYYNKSVIDKIRKYLPYNDYRKFTDLITTYRINYNKTNGSNSPYYNFVLYSSPWVRADGHNLNTIQYSSSGYIYLPEFFLKPAGPLLYTVYGQSGRNETISFGAVMNSILQEMFPNAENAYLSVNLADAINASIRGDGPTLLNKDSTEVMPEILTVLSSGKYKNATVMGGTVCFDGLFGVRDMPVNFIRVGGLNRGVTYSYVRKLSENIFNPPALLREPGKRYAVYPLNSIGNNIRNYLENDDLSGALYYVAKGTTYGAPYYAFEGNPCLMFCYDNVYFYGYFRNYSGELIYQYISDKRFKDQEQMLPPEVDVDIKTYRGSEFIEVTPIYIDNSGTGLKYRKYAWTNSTNKPTDSQYIEYEGGTISPPYLGTWYLWLKTEDFTITRIISDGVFEGQIAEEMFGPYEITDELLYLTIEPAEVTIVKTETLQLITKAVYQYKTVDVTTTAQYESSDPEIVTVNEQGVITGKEVGQATITATYEGKQAQCKVTVEEPEKVIEGDITITKTPTYIFTKWNKTRDGQPSRMNITLNWNNLRVLVLKADKSILRSEPVVVTRMESQHKIIRYTNPETYSWGTLVDSRLTNVSPGSGSYHAVYEYDKAGKPNSPFTFVGYYTYEGQELSFFITVNIPVNGITTTLLKPSILPSSSGFLAAATNYGTNKWRYSGVWPEGGMLILGGSMGGSSSEFEWPVPGYTTISSYYGRRVDPIDGTVRMHYGIDIPAPEGTNIVAPDDGKVVYVGYDEGFGNMLVIRSGIYDFVFGHCSNILVSNGQTVSKGQVIAKVGSTGRATGPHLDFRVTLGPYTQGNYIDPLTVVNPAK